MWAQTPGDHPDGICIDAEGAVWYADVSNQHCVRVREGGEVLATVSFACGAGVQSQLSAQFRHVHGHPRDRMIDCQPIWHITARPVSSGVNSSEVGAVLI